MTSTQGIRSITMNVAGHATVLQYTVAGPDNAESVLVLHGWGSNASVMESVVRFLSKSFRVYNLELPGHGNTPPPAVAWGLEEHAEAVREFVRRTVANKFSIFGHSNGGRIALFLASEMDAPAALRSLILVSPSGIRRKPSFKVVVRRTLATLLKAPFQILPGRAKEYGLDWLRHTLIWSLLGSSDYRSLHGVMRTTFVKTVNSYVEDRLSKIRIPVLMFRGEKDDAITDDQMKILEAGIDDAGLVTVEDAGHYAFLDRPDIVESGTMLFLSGS